jgi:16S rRNA (adenine1518-N6/adenine1519-N6)-dimethyltransferase
LKDLDIRASKKMGQNFLIRYKVVSRIINAANIIEEDNILEVGPGLGILTYGLVSSKCANIKVIEKDERFEKYLKKEFPDIEVIIEDALEYDWDDNVKLISNLPYSISTPIIAKILHHPFKEAVIMVQKEVAARCTAKVGSKEYSRLSVLCQLHAKVESLFDVPPDAFFPQPKVHSTVIKLIPYKPELQNDHLEIELLVRNLFTLKRRVTRSVVRGYLKRREVDPNSWEKMPHKDNRISSLNIMMIDEILTHLKKYEAWPLA